MRLQEFETFFLCSGSNQATRPSGWLFRGRQTQNLLDTLRTDADGRR